jgi:hypothetical protein
MEVVGFTARPLYFWESTARSRNVVFLFHNKRWMKSSEAAILKPPVHYQLDTRLGRSQNWSGRDGEGEHFGPGRPVRPVAHNTILYQYLSNCGMRTTSGTSATVRWYTGCQKNKRMKINKNKTNLFKLKQR